MLLSLQNQLVYGPVRSRRLGISLGINALPPGRKTCTLNCLYCQYGWTDRTWMESVDDGSYPPVHEVLRAIERALKFLSGPPAYITFSGNGEPTLHPSFPELVEGVRKLRERYSPTSRTAILSNSTRVTDPRIRKALAGLDVRIMKLDAGTPDTFLRYNQPVLEQDADRCFREIVEGLRAMEDVTIQALFTGGPKGNFKEDELKAWVDCLAEISPSFVQLYTLDRDSPTRQIAALEQGDLVFIKSLLERERIPSGVF